MRLADVPEIGSAVIVTVVRMRLGKNRERGCEQERENGAHGEPPCCGMEILALVWTGASEGQSVNESRPRPNPLPTRVGRGGLCTARRIAAGPERSATERRPEVEVEHRRQWRGIPSQAATKCRALPAVDQQAGHVPRI